MKPIYFILFLTIILSTQMANADCQSHAYCDTFDSCYNYALRYLKDAEKYQQELNMNQNQQDKNDPNTSIDNFQKVLLSTAQNFFCAAQKHNQSDQSAQSPIIFQRETQIAYFQIRHAFFQINNPITQNNIKQIFESRESQFEKYSETYDAYYYAGRAYYELKDYTKARETLTKYIGFKGAFLLNKDKHDIKKLLSAYYYVGFALNNETNRNAKQIFTKLTEDLNPGEIIEQVGSIDNVKVKENVQKWIDDMNKKFTDFIPPVEEHARTFLKNMNFRLKLSANYQDNINLLPDKLPDSTTEMTDIYSIDSDTVFGILSSARYHLVDIEKHQFGIDGMYYENFHDEEKEFDFRAFSARTFYDITIAPPLSASIHYAYLRYCINSKKFQRAHDIGARLRWKFQLIKPSFEASVQYKHSFLDNYQNSKLDGNYSVLSGGLRNISDISSFFVFRNARFFTECQIDNRSTNEESDKTYSGYLLALGMRYAYLIQHADIYCNISYRKRTYDQDDQFFAVYREEKKKIIKAGIDWHHWDNAVTLSLSFKRTRNDASFELFDYTNNEWLFSVELKPFLLL
ncbi:MAG: hypothetical protein OMM_01374 [Candidatus Magnetoglobus multicellularis str. Araruama]|uniref:TPR repeat-containing protein n=1 Tax=Candidatus Magnetoglobus multicellularis str. Araruama TaxID=890399 RepID=A0A1V1PD71_9BACT|nr:MAG: hypothetical protein OMM_01374 [Candidatus Magnetoglobus multicellularis str. Araruama]